MTDKKYCIIGDLHGRIDTLNRIIDLSPNYHYVFLGDIIHHKPHFKRTKRSSPIRMLKIVKGLTDKGQASAILGNNENYILKNLILPKSKIRQREVKFTLQCLKELKAGERIEILHWLANLPLTLEFKSYGKLYRCAHGYYDSNYTTENRNEVLSGLGYPWFRQDCLTKHLKSEEAQYFLGHYGYPYFRQNLKIIDATNFEGVGVYYTDRDEFMIYY
jgi:hypothetical protein